MRFAFFTSGSWYAENAEIDKQLKVHISINRIIFLCELIKFIILYFIYTSLWITHIVLITPYSYLRYSLYEF